MIRNIVFDMGHVLMWFLPMEACQNVTKTQEDAQTLYDAYFGGPLWVQVDSGELDSKAFTDRVKALLPPRLHDLVDTLYNGMPANVMIPIDGMAELTDELLNRGLHVYLLSNAGKFLSRKRDVIPHIGRFHGVMFSGDELIIKPDPRLYQRLTDKYDLKPEECLFVDDREDNVQAAAALGWQTHQFAGDIPALKQVLYTL